MKPAASAVALTTALAGLTAFAQAPVWKNVIASHTLSFPADHASHPEYKNRVVVLHGNLDATDGHRFGYQLTFFRVGVDPEPTNPSRWAVRDLFMTHFAVSDITGKRYKFSERINRAGPGWAGAATDRYRVWNEDWEATRDDGALHHLRAVQPDIGIDLQLAEDRPAALHGDRGFSRKGSEPGNATEYYSLTRMPTRGTLTIDGRAFSVSGSSWMDHEFGTSLLEAGQAGWDWFSIQLDSGYDLMIFQLRRADGSMDPHSAGTLVAPDGTTTPITFESGFHLVAGRPWTSPSSGARYPLAWDIDVPAKGIKLSVTAALEDQELHTNESTGVTYWEGAIDVSGQAAGRATKGRGYLEMTGYAGPSMGTVLR